jgi:hypothetical protein
MMATPYYRLTVVACAVLWLMVGLPLPALHQIIGHGHPLSAKVIVILTLNVALAVAGLWVLLRVPRRP